MDEMEEACCSSVQAHDVESARQMIQQHQDLKKRLSLFSVCLSVCLSVWMTVSLFVCRVNVYQFV